MSVMYFFYIAMPSQFVDFKFNNRYTEALITFNQRIKETINNSKAPFNIQIQLNDLCIVHKSKQQLENNIIFFIH